MPLLCRVKEESKPSEKLIKKKSKKKKKGKKEKVEKEVEIEPEDTFPAELQEDPTSPKKLYNQQEMWFNYLDYIDKNIILAIKSTVSTR